ncbi:MAG: hypothetical protein K0R63_1141 [Rickettsiales bacterium]|jgi:serine/threonine protein kinase|nr:hypothetical protein [Rickettsiales bacterium]
MAANEQDLRNVAKAIGKGKAEGEEDAGDDSKATAFQKGQKASDVFQEVVTRGTVSDVVAGKYEVHVNRPIAELDTDFAKAYKATEAKHGDSDIYALVFKKSMPLRIDVLRALKNRTFNHLIFPLSSEVITISNSGQKFFTVIFERPKGKTLTQMLEENHEFSENYVTQRVITPIVKLLTQLEQAGIAHGSLHPDNIYIDEHGTLNLSECVSEPPGYSQHSAYETVDRAICIPTGKGRATIKDDYYALGVLVLHLLLGHLPNTSADAHTMVLSKLTLNSYNTLATDATVSSTMNDLLIGLLNDKQDDRWGGDMVISWLKGRRFNLMTPSAPKEGTRAIHFNGKAHFNSRSLAYDLYRNWNDSKKFLMEEHVTKWVEGSLGKAGLANLLRHIKNSALSAVTSRTTFDNYDQLVAETIIALDPTGPLRVHGYAFDLHSLGLMLAYGSTVNNTNYIQLAANILNSHIPSIWLDLRSTEEKTSPDIAALSWMLDKASTYVTQSAIGFGIERCLYETNIGLPCQSPLVNKDYITNLPELMESLESYASTAKENDPIMDRHIAAFIGQKINLITAVRIKGLSRFPEFADNKTIEILAILAMAQRKIAVKKLKHLSAHIKNQLMKLLENIHSQSIRKELQSELDKYAKEGNLPLLLRIISNPQFLGKDTLGFKQAKRKYRQLYERKKLLQNTTQITNSSYRYGLQLSVIISYLLTAVEILYLVATNM